MTLFGRNQADVRPQLCSVGSVKRQVKWTRPAGPLGSVFSLEVRPLGVPFYHAARGCVCSCGCGPVGNAEALSIMSTALTPAVASRQTAIGERSARA